MELCKDKEWLAIKELEPLQFMGYVAEVSEQVTGHHLEDLSSYTGWIRAGGYYHWKVARMNQLKHCPHFKGIPVPKGPMAQPSSRQQPQPSHGSGKPKDLTTSVSRWDQGDESSASEDLDELPKAVGGSGDGQSWYARTVQEEGRP